MGSGGRTELSVTHCGRKDTPPPPVQRGCNKRLDPTEDYTPAHTLDYNSQNPLDYNVQNLLQFGLFFFFFFFKYNLLSRAEEEQERERDVAYKKSRMKKDRHVLRLD